MTDATPARDDVVEVTVRALASSGSGVADLDDGRVLFVPRTTPGDRVRVRLGKVKSRWAEGTLEEVLQEGEERIPPACKLYAECGGCSLQHVTYESELRWKARFIVDALERIGGRRIGEVEVLGGAQSYGYRNRVTYTLRRLRGGRIVAGFHALGRPSHVLDVADECLLPEGPLRSAWTALRAGWGQGARHLPTGGRLRLTLRTTADGPTLLVDGGPKGWTGLELANHVPEIVAIWHQSSDGKRAELVRGIETLDPWGDETIPVVGRSFLQVNRDVAAQLSGYVAEVAGSPETAVDAYCGVGVYARALARTGTRVTALEIDPDACSVARAQAPEGLEVLEGRVEELLASVLPTDLLILNPPRIGLDESIPEAIQAAPPARIIYVSCDPATLARDLARLGPAYEVESVAAFDLFPRTAHVETVLVLRFGGVAP